MHSGKEKEGAYRKAEFPSQNAWQPFIYYRNEFPGDLPYIEPHFHAEFEIDYMVAGQMLFHIDNRDYLGKEGDIFIIPPDKIHSIYPIDQKDSVGKYHTILFTSELLFGSISERCYAEIMLPLLRNKKKIALPITKLHPYYNEIQTSMDNIVVALRENTPLHDLMLKSELLRVFYLFLQYDDGTQSESQAFPAEIYNILKYIAQNYSEKLSIQDLAQMSFLSNSRFITVFKRIVGMTPSRYIGDFRLKNVCRMLVDTDATVISIANACGFNNISNFNVQFKNMFGMPPQEYRNRSRDYKNYKIN